MGASPAPYIPESALIYRLALTWPHLTQNIKDYQMKKIHPTMTNKKKHLGAERMKKQSTALFRLSSTTHHKNEDCFTRQFEIQMAHILWDERRKWMLVMETCCELHALCLIETDSNTLTGCKQGTERRWTVLMACREWASSHIAFTTERLEEEEEEEREGWNQNRRVTGNERY